MERLGEKIRTLRRKRNLTLMQMAAMLDIKSYSHLAAIENDRRKPSLELLVKIADLFNVTTDQLMRDELEVD
jgi:transcriptional regulator with XRE-family HTH domain